MNKAIDWAVAPEGTTHHVADAGCVSAFAWYRSEGPGRLYYWENNAWQMSLRYTLEELEAALPHLVVTSRPDLLIDWSKSPEGTTHAYLSNPGVVVPTWYKLDVKPDGPTRLYYHDRKQWVPSTNTIAWFRSQAHIYTRPAAPTPTSDRDLLAELLMSYGCEGCRQLADAVLAAGFHRAGVVVPEGWQLVPVNPTQSMVAVGCEDEGSRITDGAAFARSLYAAMLAVAPKPVRGAA